MVHFKWLNYMVCALLYLNKVVFKNCQGLWGAGVAEVSLSCAASVWLWGRYNAGLKGELAAVSLAPFARVGL